MAGRRDFLPSKEFDLLYWSRSFRGHITAAPQDYGLSQQDADDYSAAHDAFEEAYTRAIQPITRTSANVTAKNTAMKELVALARSFSRMIQGNRRVSDGQKITLGLTVRIINAPALPVPDEAPRIQIIRTDGHMLEFKLYASGTLRRGRPIGVAGASIFTWVGNEPSNNPADWKFEFNTTKTKVRILFPLSVAPGTQVWVCARWYNPTAKPGPLCAPRSAYVQFGGAMYQDKSLAA